MCGIVGYVNHSAGAEDSKNLVLKMSKSIEHRGPDSFGIWQSADGFITFGHRRLAIIDLTPSGAQPMESESGRFVITFNGEIYNYQSIRKELETEGYKFRGTSDTEILVNAVELFGIESTLKKISGMFAFCVFDKNENKIFLARDRLGEKPLFYRATANSFSFASELKPITFCPGFTRNISKRSLYLFLEHSCVPAPYSIFEDIQKLQPGHFISVDLNRNYKIEIKKYWELKSFTGVKRKISFSEASAELDFLLNSVVKEQMLSDAPLGAFLSGGVDSSLVTALMQKNSSKAIQTFTIGFHEKEFNEAEHAKQVAKHLNTNHHELYLTAKDTINVIQKLPQYYDEPFSDSSQIPTFLLSKFARSKVTVALSGDGGDEVFGGYTRYIMGPDLWNKLRVIPHPLRLVLAKILNKVPHHWWPVVLDFLKIAYRKELNQSLLLKKWLKVLTVMDVASLDELYFRLVKIFQYPENYLLSPSIENKESPWTHFDSNSILNQDWQRMQYMDTLHYLPDDVLTKVDRATMAVSLESRAPLIDHRVLEFSWGLPNEFLVQNGVGKVILRELLYKHVPKELIDRPKTGFSVPIGSWMRSDLRELCEIYFNQAFLKDQNLFNSGAVQKMWQNHLSGAASYDDQLWAIFMFQAWYIEQGFH